MSEMIQLENLSLDTLTELAKESFADCQDALQVYLDNEKKLKRFGDILRACRAKVPHGQWQQWVLETFAGHLSIRAVQLWIAEAQEPEKRQKRLDDQKTRDQKTRSKAQSFALLPEQPPAPPVFSGTIRNEAPPAPQTQPAKPEWLADPDELDRPEEDGLPPLPKTNTHHTAQNRRTPDARETDRVGIVPPDDPKTYHDGHWYEWSEDRGRMVAVTDEEILRRADEIRDRRGARVQQVMPVIPWPPETAPVAEHAGATNPVVEHKRDSVSSKPGKVPTVTQLRSMVEQRADIGTHRHLWSEAMVKAVQEWASYKQSLTGKAKVRSLEQWGVALSRIENVVMIQGWPAVADMIQKAIANGWQGWEHETSGSRPRGAAGGRVYQQLQKAEVKYDPLPE